MVESPEEIPSVLQNHPTEDALEEYAFGRSGEDQAAAVEEHLLICVACQAVLQEIDDYIRLMKVAAVSCQPEAHAPSFTLRRLGWAPALALLGVFAVLLLRPTAPVEPFSVSLTSYRGGENASMAHAPAGRPLDLSVNAVDLPAATEYRMEVVTSGGRVMWTSRVKPAAGKLSEHVLTRLSVGLYWVRVYGQGEELLIEFGLRVE